MGWTVQGLYPGSEAHPVSYLSGTRVLSLGWRKWLGHDVDHSPPFSTEIKNEWSYTSTPPVCLHGINSNVSLSFSCVQEEVTSYLSTTAVTYVSNADLTLLSKCICLKYSLFSERLLLVLRVMLILGTESDRIWRSKALTSPTHSAKRTDSAGIFFEPTVTWAD
jgi:hypothetical protein